MHLDHEIPPLELVDEAATVRLAQQLARSLEAHTSAVRSHGFNLRLTGDLGAGKTAFTRALLRALGVTGRVRSPTFELVEDYDVLDGIEFHHFDFYRFESPVEFDEAGFRDLFGTNRITVCEWSEKAAPYLPACDAQITLTNEGATPNSRRARIELHSELADIVFAEVLREN